MLLGHQTCDGSGWGASVDRQRRGGGARDSGNHSGSRGGGVGQDSSEWGYSGTPGGEFATYHDPDVSGAPLVCHLIPASAIPSPHPWEPLNFMPAKACSKVLLIVPSPCPLDRDEVATGELRLVKPD